MVQVIHMHQHSLYALLNGKDIETALKFGSASAAIVVSKHSSSDAMPTLEEIEQLISRKSLR